MKEIPLTQGKVALVDDDMYEELNQYKWYAHKFKYTFYAKRMSSRINGKRKVICMHHEIINKPPKDFETDHRNGNGLHNFKKNLRHVTRRQNLQNLQNIKKSSQYPGVYWGKRDKKWVAQIKINGKHKHLGCFFNELDAFNAYKIAVEKLDETVIDITIQQRSIL